MNLKRYNIQIMMLERPKISPSQQLKSIGILPSDLEAKSLGMKIKKRSSDLKEKFPVTWASRSVCDFSHRPRIWVKIGSG